MLKNVCPLPLWSLRHSPKPLIVEGQTPPIINSWLRHSVAQPRIYDGRGFHSRLGGLGESRKFPQWGLGRSPSRQRILEHLESNLACFGNIFKLLLSDYLFFTMYIKYFFRRANRGFNPPPLATPLTPL